jgi:acetyl esterase/lipase
MKAADLLRDHRIAHAERLRREGNVVDLANDPGMIHPLFSMGGVIDAAPRAHEHAASALKMAFGTNPAEIDAQLETRSHSS